ncbi:MAG: hypothetical protein JW863_09930 [Chitinispirillaceae bacterium]|nr:hypothetical protein [Chitinispirillaceae bacterium]
MHKLGNEIEERQLRFERYAVDVDIGPLPEKPDREFNWQKEIGRLLRPIMREMGHTVKYDPLYHYVDFK